MFAAPSPGFVLFLKNATVFKLVTGLVIALEILNTAPVRAKDKTTGNKKYS